MPGIVACRRVAGLLMSAAWFELGAGVAHAQVAQADQASTAATATPVSDEGLKEIVVTAERRSADVQKTAVAVSVRSGDDLRQQGRFTVQDILQDVPGVTALAQSDTAGGRTDNVGASLRIRGLSSSGQSNGTIVSPVPAVAYYVDNVYEGVGGDYDLDRVEVLRGPQGTLYGRSATAGVVAVHTKNPTIGTFGGDGSFELGNYELRHYTAALNVPIGETLAIRVSGNRYQRVGYDSDEGGRASSTSGRVKLLFKPSESFSALLGAQLNDSKFGSGGVQYMLSAPDTSYVTDFPLGSGETHARQYWGEFNWDAGPIVVSYLPAYRTFTQDTTLVTAGPIGPLIQPDLTPKDHFLTQEIRLSSSAGSKLTWQTGAFYYDNHLTASTSLVFSNGALAYSSSNHRHTENFGVFGEATYPITDTLRLTGGLRYDHTYVQNNEVYVKNINGNPFPALPVIASVLNLSGDAATRKFNNITFKARVEHDLAPTNLVYGMISSGFLPGDVQAATGPSGLPEIQAFKSETVTSFEFGTKNRFLDRRLQANAAIFYYRYGGYQTNGVDVSTNPLLHYFQTLSVPARMYGGELELLFKPSGHDQFQLDYSYVNAYFVDRPALITNKKFTNVTPHTINGAYTHTFDLSGGSKLALHGDARFLSAHDVNGTLLTPTLVAQGAGSYVRQGDYVIGDVSATWTSAGGELSITGYVRNVGDKRTKTRVLAQTITPFKNVSYNPSDPRTYGIVVAAHF